jgi:hypothetical protein
MLILLSATELDKTSIVIKHQDGDIYGNGDEKEMEMGTGM